MVNHNTCVRKGTEKTLLEEATILFYFLSISVIFFFQQLQPQIQLAYKIAVFESEQTTHILKNTRPNFSLL